MRNLSGQSTLEKVEEVEKIIDDEFKEIPKGVSFYKGVYIGDFDRVHLLKLATLLAHWNLNKETK